MNRYVKKPIAIEAVKWKGFNNDEIKDFAGDSVKIEVIREGDADNGIPPSVDCSIETLEGVMKANVGDYIIVAEEDLKLMKYVSKHNYSFVPKI